MEWLVLMPTLILGSPAAAAAPARAAVLPAAEKTPCLGSQGGGKNTPMAAMSNLNTASNRIDCHIRRDIYWHIVLRMVDWCSR